MLLLSNLLTKFIQTGTLRVFDSGGKLHSFGDKAPGPTVTLRLHDRALEVKLALNPELYAGEAYMDGTLTFEEGTDVGDLMGLFSLNRTGLFGHASQRLLRRVWRAARRWHQANPIGVAARMRDTITISISLFIGCSWTKGSTTHAPSLRTPHTKRSNRRS